MLKFPINTFHIHDQVLVAKPDDIMHGFVGKVIAHYCPNAGREETQHFKVKFDFKKDQPKPVPKNGAFRASNIQYRIFEESELIMDTKLNRLLYG